MKTRFIGDDGCPIWSSKLNSHRILDDGITTEVGSDRAGGKYVIGAAAWGELHDSLGNSHKLDDAEKARLTTMLVDMRLQGDFAPVITAQLVREAKNKQPLPIHERADRLLRYFVEKSDKVGDDLEIGDNNDPMCWGAMAWSESKDPDEVLFLAEYLEQRGLIQGELGETLGSAVGWLKVSVEGYGHIADLASNQDSAQCFVAMWFNGEMDTPYEQGIKPAIEAAGYTPMRIDKKPHANKIDDEIIAEIRRSRFLIADFTHGDDGARGGVYYEAGFAHGLNLPVIFSCSSDMVDKLHFDTRQYNHIVWETPEELRRDLTNRIEAVVGEGPNKGTTTT